MSVYASAEERAAAVRALVAGTVPTEEIAARRRAAEADVRSVEVRARRERWRSSFEAFRYEALPLHFRQDYGTSAFGSAMDLAVEGIRGAPLAHKHAFRGPRGNAKSTMLALAAPIWYACEPSDDLRYWLIGRGRYSLAERDVDAIRLELESNEAIQEVYGDLRGPEWNKGCLITSTGVRIEAFGADQNIRGFRWSTPQWGTVRPRVLVLDDLDKDAASREVRKGLRDWLRGAVRGLSDPRMPMHLLAAGTPIDLDTLIWWLGSDAPGWTGHTYRALVELPDEVDGLWAQWAAVYDTDREAGQPNARAFYDDRRAAMDAGAVVLWPGGESLYDLMAFRHESPGAFGAEKQCEPRNSEDALIQADWIVYWGDAADRPAAHTMRVVAIDPSLGKKGGDFSAIVTLGRCADGLLDVVRADIARRDPARIVSDAVRAAKEDGAVTIRCEDVAFQNMLLGMLLAEARRQGVSVGVEGYKPTTDKPLRLQRLQPRIKGGVLRFQRGRQRMLIDQLLAIRNDGTSVDHDDGPDALDMAVERLSFSGGGLSAGALEVQSDRPNGRGIGDTGNDRASDLFGGGQERFESF